jgi:hypothetical protein
MNRPPIWGLMAELELPQDILRAAKRAHAEGYRQIDAYTPFPVHGLHDAIGHHTTRLPLIVLIGGVVGCLSGFLLQYYATVIDYPINIAGRPLNSWPMFIPVTFELTILVAGFATVLGMLGLNGLPTPYHPVFNVSRFELASRTHFFLVIEATDPKFDPVRTRAFLESLGPSGVYEVDH